ncbi:putative E1-like protein-activating enzyme Gsa7p/Apg7p [Cooperia oncophora]
MEQSVELNLSLMKWRLVPEMKLERYTSLKVLIFGAGTLGSNIARCLMGWGVKKITFVDNSFVSYSNPIRQSLSEFTDAREGRGKAETAASALRRIYPSIEAEAVLLTVPMPGHTVAPSEEAALAKDVETIEQLVSTHDVVFLALDSREARWLPTVLATKHGKMAFSVALGFDNYVVIRHGVKNGDSAEEQSSSSGGWEKIHCPGVPLQASLRFLHVSRAGLSMIASGVAVELLSSVLQYSNPLRAPANIGEPDDSTSLLGATPHQVRGYLSRFSQAGINTIDSIIISSTFLILSIQMTPCVRRFEKCVACGNTVAEEYANRGADFVKEVLVSSLA